MVLGEEKRAKPRPRRIKLAIIKGVVVFSFRKIKRKSPTVVRAIPVEATILGSIRSESLPVKGEKSACIIGWETRIMPAS